MEQHPVPQNVTTFQFRLIGDMTLKQFGYLVGGAIVAYIMYKLPLPFFFTWPLTIFSAVGGFGLAFVPIEERPMDIWVLSFIKSVYSPTQYIWSRPKAENPRREAQESKNIPPPAPAQRMDVLQHIFVPAQSPMPGQKNGVFDWISGLWTPKVKTAPVKHMDFTPPPVVRPAQNVEKILKETQQKESVLENKVKTLQTELERTTDCRVPCVRITVSIN